MSSSKAARERAAKYSTPERIKEWCKLYHDGIIDGDKIRILEDMYEFKAGTIGIVEIRWDSRVNCPVRSVFFGDFGMCGLPKIKFEKVKE